MDDYRLIKMTWKEMKYEFGDFIKFRIGTRYEVYENCDSYKVFKIKRNKYVEERTYIFIL